MADICPPLLAAGLTFNHVLVCGYGEGVFCWRRVVQHFSSGLGRSFAPTASAAVPSGDVWVMVLLQRGRMSD